MPERASASPTPETVWRDSGSSKKKVRLGVLTRLNIRAIMGTCSLARMLPCGGQAFVQSTA
jgi:hypothetical protein